MAQSDLKHFMNEFQTGLNTLRKISGAEKKQIEGVINEYHEQRKKGEDGISTTSQTMWYSNKLSRTAMERHGIRMSEIYRQSPDKSQDIHIYEKGDGNHKRITYTSLYSREKIFYKGDNVVYKCKDSLQEEYILADTMYENSPTKYCDNCGGLMDISKGYQGCPFCGAPVRIKETHKKIMTVNRAMTGDWYRKCIILATILVLFVLGLIWGFIDNMEEGTFEYGIYAGAIALIVLQAAIMAGFSGFILAIFLSNIILTPILCSIQSSNRRVAGIGYEMRKRDLNFSSTEIYGTIQLYAKLWFLAGSKVEMGCVSQVQCNQDDGIVDAECVGLKKARCWEDNGYTYIESKLLVRYITVSGDKMKKKRKKTLVTLRRKKDVQSSLKTEALKCSRCGANIDILSGACIACGNSMDVEDYDWVLYDIRNV